MQIEQFDTGLKGQENVEKIDITPKKTIIINRLLENI